MRCQVVVVLVLAGPRGLLIELQWHCWAGWGLGGGSGWLVGTCSTETDDMQGCVGMLGGAQADASPRAFLSARGRGVWRNVPPKRQLWAPTGPWTGAWRGNVVSRFGGPLL